MPRYDLPPALKPGVSLTPQQRLVGSNPDSYQFLLIEAPVLHEVRSTVTRGVNLPIKPGACDGERQVLGFESFWISRALVSMPAVTEHTPENLHIFERFVVTPAHAPPLSGTCLITQRVMILNVSVKCFDGVEGGVLRIRLSLVENQYLISVPAKLFHAARIQNLCGSLLKPLNVAHMRNRPVVILRIDQRGQIVHVVS